MRQDERLDAGAKLIQLGTVTISILSNFACLFAVSSWMRRLYPGIDKARRRIGWSPAFGVPVVSLLMILGDGWQTHLRGEEAGNVFLWGNLPAGIFQALAISIFITGIPAACIATFCKAAGKNWPPWMRN